jgi:hypothetical protein
MPSILLQHSVSNRKIFQICALSLCVLAALTFLFLAIRSHFEKTFNLGLTNIGVVTTLIASLLACFISIWNIIATRGTANKNSYINSVTSARLKYIDGAKKMVSDYCGMVKSLTLSPAILATATPTPSTADLLQKIDSLRYYICFQLNYKDRFDQLFMIKLKNIANLASPHMLQMNQQEQELQDIAHLMQAWVKCEWEGIKLESMYGVLPKDQKNRLWGEYLKEHVDIYETAHPGELRKYPGNN